MGTPSEVAALGDSNVSSERVSPRKVTTGPGTPSAGVALGVGRGVGVRVAVGVGPLVVGTGVPDTVAVGLPGVGVYAGVGVREMAPVTVAVGVTVGEPGSAPM